MQRKANVLKAKRKRHSRTQQEEEEEDEDDEEGKISNRTKKHRCALHPWSNK
jgi:hypothetical protein